MRLRHVSVAALIACGLLVPTTAAAAAGPARPAASQVKATKSAKPSQPAKPSKPAKPVKFAASGVVDAVDAVARTITVTVKGGATGLRGKTITFSVAATARITLNDTSATLAEVQTGYRTNVHGEQIGSVYTAARINASTPEPQPNPPATTAPSPTA